MNGLNNTPTSLSIILGHLFSCSCLPVARKECFTAIDFLPYHHTGEGSRRRFSCLFPPVTASPSRPRRLSAIAACSKIVRAIKR